MFPGLMPHGEYIIIKATWCATAVNPQHGPATEDRPEPRDGVGIIPTFHMPDSDVGTIVRLEPVGYKLS